MVADAGQPGDGNMEVYDHLVCRRKDGVFPLFFSVSVLTLVKPNNVYCPNIYSWFNLNGEW